MTALSAADRDRLLAATPAVGLTGEGIDHDELQFLLAAWHDAGYVVIPMVHLATLTEVLGASSSLAEAMRGAP